MEASSSGATDGLSQEQLLELEDVWSELYALKKLYGLLQKTSAEVSNADGHDNLDDKARLLLKKLLDGATHHALQYQAKIVCSPPGPPLTAEVHRPSHESLEKETKRAEELQKCQPGTQILRGHPEESTGPPHTAAPGAEQNELKSLAVAEPKIIRKPCPIRETSDLKRQISSKTTSSRISDRKSSLRHRHRPMHHDRDRRSRIRSSKEKPNRDYLAVVPAKSPFSVPEDQQTRGDGPHNDKQDKTRRMMSRHCRTSNRDLLAMVPARKRARVEATDRLGRATSETRIDGPAKKERNQMVEIGRIDQRKAGIIAHSKQESVTPGRDGSISRRRRPPSHPKSPSPGPSQPRHQKLTRLPSSHNRAGARDQAILQRTKLPPRIVSRIESTRCSSLSCTSESGCSTSSTESDTEVAGLEVGWSKKKAGPIFARDEKAAPPRRTRSYRQLAPSRGDATRRRSPPKLPRQQAVGPKKRTTRADEEKKPLGGRLRGFKDRLAIIFHHHHHHHLHPAVHVDGDDDPSRPHHRTPWKYIRSVVSRRPTGDHERLKRAPAQQQHGHVYALLEAMVRHVWGLTRRRKAVPGRPRKTGGTKKVHWWQRFRRRGGVKLAGRRTKPRLKLLGYTRSHSRTNRKG